MAYKTINESFWTDPKVRLLSAHDKYIFLYLISNPHAHYSGLYYIPKSFAAEESGLTLRQIDEVFSDLIKQLFIQYDDIHSVVWVINMCKYQMSQGGNPRVLRLGIEKQFQNIHSVILLKAFNEYYQILNLTLPQRCLNVEATLPQRYDTDSDPDTDKEKRIVKGKNGKKPQKTLIAPDFTISVAVRSWAAEKGYDKLEEHLESFADAAKSRSYEYADWDAAFKRAIREDWGKIRSANKKEGEYI